MFILSVKLTQKKMFLGALVLVLVISVGVLWAGYSNHKEDTVTTTKSAALEENSKKKEEEKSIKKAAAKTNEQRIAFIESFGWQVNAEAVEVLEVIIPKEFDEVYKEYNSIQKTQGCDLASHSGKRCKRYSYEIVNYPEKPENVRINLLVRNNKIIGGDVCSMESGGFMHGFKMPVK